MTEDVPARATPLSMIGRRSEHRLSLPIHDPGASWAPDGPLAAHLGGERREEREPDSAPLAKILPWLASRGSSYGASFGRVFENLPQRASSIFAEQRQASALASELLDVSTKERRQILIRNTRRYHRISTCDLLLDRSVRLAVDEPSLAQELAELALELANGMDSSECGVGLLGDTRARACAALANAHRALGFPAASTLGFKRAYLHLRQGTGNPLEEASILELEALLLSRLGHHLQAEAAVERQLQLCEQFDEPQHARRARLHRAVLGARRGDFAGAARRCRQWLEDAGAATDPLLASIAQRSRLAFLDLAGNLSEAQRLNSGRERAENGSAEGWTAALSQWLDGKARLSSGDALRARRALRAAMVGFLRRGDWYEATRAALDLLALGAEHCEARVSDDAEGALREILGSPEVDGPLRRIVETLAASPSGSRLHLEETRRELALAQCDPEVFIIRSL